ncbi:hypothetical protein GALMADRAFT_1186346 [Galerina marginata CBS 339.88]|uniref:Uncharacterized protein n=1 Tax=Galerina marginata (strain CBS 339.88) TaxID=685588 RepID=A0A067TAI7_GALM3|nr:hypothetical protein GALMADRAFT_1186346 [Galerina marginata CBS 339.88]
MITAEGKTIGHLRSKYRQVGVRKIIPDVIAELFWVAQQIDGQVRIISAAYTFDLGWPIVLPSAVRVIADISFAVPLTTHRLRVCLQYCAGCFLSCLALLCSSPAVHIISCDRFSGLTWYPLLGKRRSW